MPPYVAGFTSPTGTPTFVCFGPFQTGQGVREIVFSVANNADGYIQVLLRRFRDRPTLNSTGFLSGEDILTPSTSVSSTPVVLRVPTNMHSRIPLKLNMVDDWHWIGVEIRSGVTNIGFGFVALESGYYLPNSQLLAADRPAPRPVPRLERIPRPERLSRPGRQPLPVPRVESLAPVPVLPSAKPPLPPSPPAPASVPLPDIRNAGRRP